jgi:hypothetical protein
MCTGAEAIAGLGAAATIAGTAASTYSSMKSDKGPKLEAAPVAPTTNDKEIGEASLKRKRAAAGAFGRKSTIATSGMGVSSPGKLMTTTGTAS